MIVDTPPAFTPEVIAAVDASSDVCLVGMLDALSLKNTRLGLETLELMGYARATSASCSTAPTARSGSRSTTSQAIVGLEPDVLVPSDRAITRSVNEGMPIALKSPGRTPARRSTGWRR